MSVIPSLPEVVKNLKGGADSLSVAGVKLWDLSTFGPTFAVVAFLVYMLIQMLLHWSYWRQVADGNGKTPALSVVPTTLPKATVHGLRFVEDLANELLLFGTTIYGASLLASSIRNDFVLKPSAFVTVILVVALSYVVQIAIEGMGVIGYVAPSTAGTVTGGGTGGAGIRYQNCSGVWPSGASVEDQKSTFPLANAASWVADNDTFVCSFAPLVQNNIYLWAQALQTNALTPTSFTVALLLVAARIYVSRG